MADRWHDQPPVTLEDLHRMRDQRLAWGPERHSVVLPQPSLPGVSLRPDQLVLLLGCPVVDQLP
ncbi:MAG TPA: hypothetical protein VKK81_25175 [Candidatus Binatia bacterium]|nr:hypothetical protein [Candidatus Binatia bacterium]